VLSGTVVEYLSTRPYRADARRETCVLPYCGICWDDEVPQARCFEVMSEADLHSIFRLFALRLELWKGKVLEDADRRFWEEARQQVPTYALFRRLVITDQDRRAQAEVERELATGLQVLISQADDVKIVGREHGRLAVSATFDLQEEGQPAGAERHRRRRWPFRWPFRTRAP